jgi:DNA polymerase-3 subunit gamma/tau
MYQVLARRFRPQTLADLVGQEAVARTLRNAVAAGRTAHAYLFTGVRGTGKTTVARILAKCLNCEAGPTPEPCLACVPCREIADGRALDVLELDAASRTGVDDIRELQEFVAFAPARDRYKVLIIDEVHMLSKSAFNALLKTLEEPPARVVFILATTELHKVLPTILSRCQLFEFRRVPPRDVAGHLRRIADGEGFTISDRALDRIARAGEGSVRDSLSILERVLAFCGNEVRDEEAMQVLGAFGVETMRDLVLALAERDPARALLTLDGVVAEGRDLVHFWTEILSIVRDLALLRACPDRWDLLARTREEGDMLAQAASGLTAQDLTRIFHLLSEIEPGLKASSQPRFVFESALLRIATLGTLRPIEEVLAEIRGGVLPRPAVPEARPASLSKAPPRPAPPASPADWVEAWKAEVHDRKPMLHAALSQAASVSVEGDVVRVVFSTPNADAVASVLRSAKAQEFLKASAERLAGRPVAVAIEEAEANPAADGNEPAASPALPSGGRRTPGSRGGELAERVRKEPGVKRLLDEFGAQIVEVRPLPSGEEPAVPVEGEGEAEETA